MSMLIVLTEKPPTDYQNEAIAPSCKAGDRLCPIPGRSTNQVVGERKPIEALRYVFESTETAPLLVTASDLAHLQLS